MKTCLIYHVIVTVSAPNGKRHLMLNTFLKQCFTYFEWFLMDEWIASQMKCVLIKIFRLLSITSTQHYWCRQQQVALILKHWQIPFCLEIAFFHCCGWQAIDVNLLVVTDFGEKEAKKRSFLFIHSSPITAYIIGLSNMIHRRRRSKKNISGFLWHNDAHGKCEKLREIVTKYLRLRCLALKSCSFWKEKFAIWWGSFIPPSPFFMCTQQRQ